MKQKQFGAWKPVDTLILVLAIGLAIGTVTMSYELNQGVITAQNSFKDDLPAFSVRAEFDHVRVLEHLYGFELGDISLNDFQVRFDILWARLEHYESAYLSEYSVPNDKVTDAINQLLARMGEIDILLKNLSVSDVVRIKQIRADLNTMYGLLSDLTTIIREVHNNVLQEIEKRRLYSVRVGSSLVISTLLMGTFLLLRVWFDLRRKIRFSGELEKEVQQRTQELLLSNDQLKKEALERKRVEKSLAKRELQMQRVKKMEAIGRITAGVAHDFNNLLAVIMGNIELLMNGPSERRTRKYLENTMVATKRGSQLTRKLLAFGRRSLLQPEPFNANQVIKDLNDLFLQSISETIELSVDLEPDVREICVDRSLFESALLNLVINARDAMLDGGTLSITTQDTYFNANDLLFLGLDLHEGSYLIIKVTDTGEGMSEHVQEHAFEPFFTTKPAASGSGLGLSMAYGFVRQSKGGIVIDSENENGTSVTLLFPIETDCKRVTHAENTSVYKNTAEPRTILLAEDSDEVRKVVAEQLHMLGYETIEASSGDAALELLKKHTVDLLLTDIVMPGNLQGGELAIEARKLQPTLKVILMSGYPNGSNSNNDDFDKQSARLIKPVSLALLSQTLFKVLDIRQQ